MGPMLKWFDVGAEAQGVVAIGGQATGVIAIGQLATGVIAIGQAARGVIVIGQLAGGVVAVGQLSVGVLYSAGMLGIGGVTPGMLVLPMFGGLGGRPSFEPNLRTLASFVGLAGLAFAWWLGVGEDLLQLLFAEGGVLNPERPLR